MVRTTAVLVAVAALFLSQESVLFACSCLPPQGIEAEVDQSASVFEGTVASVTPTKPEGIVEARFRLQRVWKGPTPAELVVRTSTLMCGLEFRAGQRWVVFGHGVPLFAGRCSPSGHGSHSGPLPFNAATLEELGKPRWVAP